MLPAFFALTYILSWVWFGVVAYILQCAGSSASGVGAFLFLPGAITPAFIAIILTARSEGRAGVSQLLAQIFRWRVPIRYYVIAVGYMAAIKLTSAAIYRITADEWPKFGAVPWYVLVIAILFSTPVQAGEEVGWRGYALPRLAERFGLPAASIILGVIWAAWHLPFFFIPGADNIGQSFSLYLIAVSAISAAMAWLYWRTNKSLLLAMLMHASMDNTAGIVTSQGTVSNPFSLPQAPLPWISTAMFCATAVWFLIQMRKQSRKKPRLILPGFL